MCVGEVFTRWGDNAHLCILCEGKASDRCLVRKESVSASIEHMDMKQTASCSISVAVTGTYVSLCPIHESSRCAERDHVVIVQSQARGPVPVCSSLRAFCGAQGPSPTPRLARRGLWMFPLPHKQVHMPARCLTSVPGFLSIKCKLVNVH